MYSGGIRTMPELIENHHRFLIDLYDCDVYMSLWDTWVRFTLIPDAYVHSDTQVSHKILDSLKEAYSPKVFDIEHFKDKVDQLLFYKDIWTLRNVVTDRVLNYISMFYKMQRCFELATTTGPVENAIYLRIRPDIIFKNPLIFDDIEKNTIYSSDNRNHTANGFGMCDQLAYGDYQAMKSYCTVWSNWLNLAPKPGLLFNPEVVLLNHVNMTGTHIAAKTYNSLNYDIARETGVGGPDIVGNNLRVMFFTNENNIPIVKLAVKYWLKYNSFLWMRDPLYVVSNKINTEDLPRRDRVEYFSAEIPYCPASTHFGPTLKKALQRTKQDFVMFLCDDYIMTDSMDTNMMAKMLRMMVYEHIDMLSFAWMCPDQFGFAPYVPDNDHGFNSGDFYLVKDSYRHRYSVQPCIWRRKALLEILERNEYLTLHALDNSSIAGKDGSYRDLDPVKNEYSPWNEQADWKHKIVCVGHRIFTLDRPSGKFGIAYHEVIRHGAFHITANGFDTDKYPANAFLLNMIEEEGLRENPEYKKYFGK